MLFSSIEFQNLPEAQHNAKGHLRDKLGLTKEPTTPKKKNSNAAQ
jgi:hypothetical protein